MTVAAGRQKRTGGPGVPAPHSYLRIRVVMCVLLPLALVGVSPDFATGQETTVTGVVGQVAKLPCDVDVHRCGNVYFITWTKNVSDVWKRIYLYSNDVEKPLQELANPDRADFFLNESRAQLHIKPVRDRKSVV